MLTFTLLTGEGPFGSWKDSELQLYTRISRRQFQIPSGLGLAIDLIDKVFFNSKKPQKASLFNFFFFVLFAAVDLEPLR